MYDLRRNRVVTSYYLNLFSPDSWHRFREHGCEVTGFSSGQYGRAQKIQPNDILLCYVKGVSRWTGFCIVGKGPYEDDTPIFSDVNDRFVVRFDVDTPVALDIEHAVPVQDQNVWNRLSITREIEPGSVGWGANFQGSLRSIPPDDGRFLIDQLKKQQQELRSYPLSDKDQRHLRTRPSVRTAQGELIVSIPDDFDTEASAEESSAAPVRQSHTIQARIAEIGAKMGFSVWLPRNDVERCREACSFDFSDALLENLPMNYNDATVRTIEQIDALWIRGRSIARAFEVEHTTAIYSGLLRMADLVALQPDIQIPLHIVAPDDRRESVFAQISRPVFSLLDTGPLSDRCTFISYNSIEELASVEHLSHMNHSIVGQYAEEADGGF